MYDADFLLGDIAETAQLVDSFMMKQETETTMPKQSPFQQTQQTRQSQGEPSPFDTFAFLFQKYSPHKGS